MDQFRYFYFCDHQFPITDQDGEIRDVTIMNDGTLIDILVDRARILEILEVRVATYDPLNPQPIFYYDNDQSFDSTGADQGYYDVGPDFNVDYSQYITTVDGVSVAQPLPTTFYERYLHNRIKWNVRPPKSYIAKVKVLLTPNQFKTVDISECPRCQSNGWFVDVLDERGAYNEATGIVRVTQRLIKDLFTEVGSNVFDPSYGTVLRNQMASEPPGASNEKLFGDVRLIVSGVEDRYLSEQAPLIPTLDDTEILEHFVCTNVMRNTISPTRVTAELTVTTRTETRNLRIPF